ncbi:hypothetical protein SVIOM342S_02145 [Streptomyces violaceorubidus]
MPAVSKEDSSVVVSGSWLTDKVYAKSGVAEVVGYDPDKGSKKWTIKLDGPVCATTRHVTDDNKTVIVHQPAMPTKAEPSHGCTQVAVLDLDAGKKVWTETAGDEPISFDNVTISGNTVAAGSTDGGVAFDLAKGDILWSPKTTDTCYDAGYGGGEKLVAVRKCGSYDARQLNIQTIDPKSGKVLSEYKMAKGIEYAGVVSTDPLVVAADVGDSAGDGSGISDFFSIDNKTGKLLTRISAPGDEFAARCDSITKTESCNGLAATTGSPTPRCPGPPYAALPPRRPAAGRRPSPSLRAVVPLGRWGRVGAAAPRERRAARPARAHIRAGRPGDAGPLPGVKIAVTSSRPPPPEVSAGPSAAASARPGRRCPGPASPARSTG